MESVLSRMGGIMQMDSPKGKGLCVTLFIPLDYINHVQNLKDSSQTPAPLKEHQV